MSDHNGNSTKELTNGFPQMWHARRALNIGDETSESWGEKSELRSNSPKKVFNGGPEFGPYFEGDILGNPYDRNGIAGESIVGKKESSDSSERSLIYKALNEIHEHTCIIFVELEEDNDNVDHLSYNRQTTSCSSYVGRSGGKQLVNLASDCFDVGHGTALHETLHAIGIFHEHTREDRDRYVKIHDDKIMQGAAVNFKKQPSNYFGVEYDYGSIMHYPADAFGNPAGAITIEVLQAGVEIGQRERISPRDAKKVGRMYATECASPINTIGFLTLWSGAKCDGKMFTTRADVPDLNTGDRYYSVQVKGAWLIYEGSNYGYVVESVSSSTLACKPLEIMSAVNGTVRSMQYVGSRQDFRAETLTIYEREWFVGKGIIFHTDTEFMNDKYTGALVVTGLIPWQVFDSVQLTGESRCVVPSPVPGQIAPAFFIYSTRGFGIPFNIRSVKLGCVEASYEDA